MAIPDVRIFVSDADEMAAIYVDGRLRHYLEYYESEAFPAILKLIGVEIEHDTDFMMKNYEDCPEFDGLAQTLDEIEDFRRNRKHRLSERQWEETLQEVSHLRRQAQQLLDEADRRERGLENNL